MIFDLLASQYGLTFRQIGKMTFREVFIAFESIMKRRKQEMIFHARCLGAEVKEDIGESFIEGDELSSGQEAMMQKAIEEQMKRKGMKRHV